MLEHFYKLTQREIAVGVERLLENELFSDNQDLRQYLAVGISGSVAQGNYDNQSDIDLDFYLIDPENEQVIREAIKTYKNSLKKRTTPIQIHSIKNINDLDSMFAEWKDDLGVSALSRSIIVLDKGNMLQELQTKYRWYPQEILCGKSEWLFAQLVFEQHEHWSVAYKRHDDYYIHVSALDIVRLAGNALLLAHNTFPVFDKHLKWALSNLPDSKEILSMIEELLSSPRHESAIDAIIEYVEHTLIDKHLITRQSTKHWLDARPKHAMKLRA